MGHYGYILWLAVFVWLPTIILWVGYTKYLIHYKKVFLYCTVYSLLLGIPWDIWAVRANMWHYYPAHILGLTFLYLPIEDYLFLLTVPVLLTSATLVAKKYFRKMV